MSAGDPREPWFALCATGHPDLIPLGPWAYHPVATAALEAPGAARVWSCLDAALARRLGTHKVAIHGRDDGGGVDAAVRAYAAARDVFYLPLAASPQRWGKAAGLRRDAELVARSDAVLWFGPEETDGDPARLAMMFGIPVQVVRSLDPADGGAS